MGWSLDDAIEVAGWAGPPEFPDEPETPGAEPAPPAFVASPP